MKNFSFIFIILFTQTSMAASITVNPFDIEFFVEKGAYEIDFNLKMACRYEKFIIGDSAQYEYIFEDVPLEVKKTKINNDLESVRIVNSSRRVLKLDGWFKDNKECQTMQEFFLKSKLYSMGWANQFDRPIRLGLFEHSRLAEYKVYDISALIDQIQGKKLGFVYKPVYNQVHVRFAYDDIADPGMSFYLRSTVLKHPDTDMPWPLRQ